MTSSPDTSGGDARSPAERVIAESLFDEAGVGRPLSARTLQRQRSVESYLRGEMLPRYIRRAAEIERTVRRHERELAAAHDALREACAGDAGVFAGRWRAHAAAADFAAVNELIRQHNDYYPIERDLPMDPRTGDYVLVSGRPYRRDELDAAWVLERFPADLLPCEDDVRRL